jgi:hypothetical protein
MKHLIRYDADEIDRALSREDDILPSSGFAASVINAVQREAATPPPIPFPWKRAMPGLVVAVLTLILVLVEGVIAIPQSARTSTSSPVQIPMSLSSVLKSIFELGLRLGLQQNIESAALWTVLALLIAWVSVKFSMFLVSDRA